MRAFVGLLLATLASACSGDENDDGASGGVGGSGASGGSGGTSGVGGGGAPAFGSVGSGDVSCAADDSVQCSAGNACCSELPLGTARCVASFAGCPCADNWDSCAVYGCDGPEDCPGAVCCATPSPTEGFHEFAGSSCKPSCSASDEVVCKVAADCPGGRNCQPSGEFFSRCF